MTFINLYLTFLRYKNYINIMENRIIYFLIIILIALENNFLPKCLVGLHGAANTL